MKAIARLASLIGLLATVSAIRDDLKEKTLELKESVHPSALVELKDAAKNKASSKSAGQAASHTVRTGKGRHHHHRHSSSEGHHHHRHKHHHHARRHHEDDDDEGTEDDRVAAREDRSLDSDDAASDDDLREERAPRHSRKEQERDDEDAEAEEDDQAEEDPPRKHRSSHAKEDHEEQRSKPAPVQEKPQTPKKEEKPVAVANSSSIATSVREAAPSPPAVGLLDALRVLWEWILPCFGWTIVIALVILVALRIKWPELSNIGVHYVARKISQSSRKRKEGHETKEKPEQKEVQGAREGPSAAPAAVSA